MINKRRKKAEEARKNVVHIPENMPIITLRTVNRRETKKHGDRIREINRGVEMVEVEFLNEIFNAEYSGNTTPYLEIYTQYQNKFDRFMKSKANQGYFEKGMSPNMNYFVLEYGPTEKETDLSIIERAAKFFRKRVSLMKNNYDCKELFKDMIPPE